MHVYDVRSYSHELFLRVQAILVKFHKADMIDDFTELADKIKVSTAVGLH